MRILSDLNLAKEVEKEFCRKVEYLKLDKSTFMDLKLCLNEAVTNAIRHGNKNNKDLFVFVDFEVNSKLVQFIVSDQGEGFDYKKVPDPTSGSNVTRPHGRGVYLIKELMDNVEFLNGGRTIKMVKYLKS